MNVHFALYNNFSPLLKKSLKRGRVVFTFALGNLVNLSFNVLFSSIAVKLFSLAWWSQLVPYLIIFQIGSFLISWGNQLYLSRTLAQNPHKIEKIWFSTLLARFPLWVIFSSMLLFFDLPLANMLIMIIWLLFNHVFRSYDALILFKRAFKFSLLLSLITSILFIGSFLFLRHTITLPQVLTLYAGIELLKLTSCYLFFHRNIRWERTFRYDLGILIVAFPFFLQGLAGLLQSRIDTYYVALTLSKEELAHYQIIISFLLLVKGVIDMFLRPFLKNIYRMNIESLQKISTTLLRYGIFISVPIIGIFYFIMHVIYGFQTNSYLLVLSYLYIIPMYYYSTKIYIYYKYQQETRIIRFGVIMILFSLLSDILLVNRFGIQGALTTAVLQEWMMLFLCSWFEKQVVYAKA